MIANPLFAPLVHLRSKGETLRDMLEGESGIVTVTEGGGDLQLRLDNYYVLDRGAEQPQPSVVTVCSRCCSTPIRGESLISASRLASAQAQQRHWA